MEAKIRSFRDLKAWQEAHVLALLIYKITKTYPDDEKFGLTNQSRRAVVSISSNIAEGFGRFSAKDKQHFYSMAKTSLAELQNQLILAKDLEYIGAPLFVRADAQSETVGALIKGLIRSASGA